MNGHFRDDQQRQSDQQARVHFEIPKEGDFDATREMPGQSREDEQRHPRQRRDDENPPLHAVERRFHQADAQQQLIQGPS